MSQRVAIIGAGAKGAAIVAKAAALKTGGHTRPPPDIDLYDDQSIGASWRGASGYTDGEQPLCTLAERDLGFPYDVQPWGRAVIAEMLSQFSWQAFSVTAPGRMRYNDWIVDGRRPPAHRVFADYLQHAVDAAIGAHVAKHVPRRVGSVDFDRGAGKWLVDSFDSGSRTTQQERYDGIVITGSGRPLPDLPNANPRVFNGQTFWSSIAQIRTLLMADLDPSVVIIGAGGTAAAIAYWFVRKGLVALPILIVGHEATLFARHDGPFEDRMFSDDVAWQALAPHVKDAFLSRTTAGVVWDYVLRNLRSDN
ncbi:MAG TPA: SidA/IucD/PvdA family monooxygenase, partial [Casimicrobiaceae bacterium]|nr:SidA/IucD/PvdA family monooxygenase [Casimicrobiaceae bacterium]